MHSFVRTLVFLVVSICNFSVFSFAQDPVELKPKIAGLETVGVERWSLLLAAAVDPALDEPSKRPIVQWAEISKVLRTQPELSMEQLYSWLEDHPMWEEPLTSQDLWELGRNFYDFRRRAQNLKLLTPQKKRELSQLFSFLAEEAFYVFNQRVGQMTETFVWGGISCEGARSGKLFGVSVCPGDVVLTKGEAVSSSMLSRFADRPGSFSHAALVHVLPGGEVILIESLIEDGVKLRRAAAIEARALKRAFVYRLGRDVPNRRQAFSKLQAALDAFVVSMRERVQDPFQQTLFPYDFAMKVETENSDPAMFCTEVPEWIYRAHAKLPTQLNPYPSSLWSTISGPNRDFFNRFLGITEAALPAPSDLDVNPSFEIVGAKVDTGRLWEDRLHVAFIDSLLDLAKEKPKAFEQMIVSLEKIPAVVVDQEMMDWVRVQDWIPAEYRQQLSGHVPVGIDARQLVFFLLLNKWAAEELSKDFADLKDSVIDPVELRVEVRKWIAEHYDQLREQVRRAAARFPAP
jgi:hypothetical protein